MKDDNDDDDDCWSLVFPLSGIESPVSARFNLRPATFLNSFWTSSLHHRLLNPGPIHSHLPPRSCQLVGLLSPCICVPWSDALERDTCPALSARPPPPPAATENSLSDRRLIAFPAASRSAAAVAYWPEGGVFTPVVVVLFRCGWSYPRLRSAAASQPASHCPERRWIIGPAGCSPTRTLFHRPRPLCHAGDGRS